MKIYCPHCNQIYDIDTNLWGRYVECEVCNKKFVAGQSAFKNRPASQICLPTPPQKRNRISPKTIIAIFGGFSMLLVVSFTWFMTKIKSDGIDEAKVCQKIVSISELDDSKIDNCEIDEKSTINVPAPNLHEEKPCPKEEREPEFGGSKIDNSETDEKPAVNVPAPNLQEEKPCPKEEREPEFGGSKIDNCETDEKPAVNVPVPKLYKEKPCPKEESESDFGDSKFYNYKSNKKLTVDLSKRATYRGALGFRWGDRPKVSGCKFPCNIEHPSEGTMFSKVKLGYNPRGELFCVECSRTYDISIPNFRQAPRRMQKNLRINFIEQTCLPIFNTIKEVAEIILDKNFECFYGEKQFTGMTTDEGNIMGIIRLDIKDNGPFAMMSIMNLNQK